MIYDLRDKNNEKKGFSLIEAIVVVAMMGLMFVGGTVVYSNFTNRKEVDEATSKIISQLEIARSNAKAGILPPGVAQNQTNVNNFRYVAVTLTTVGVLTVASNHGGSNVYSTTNIESVNFSRALNGCDVCFSAGESKLVTTVPAPQVYTYNVSLTISSKKVPSIARTITIDSNGVIRRQ